MEAKIENVSGDPKEIKAMGKASFVASHSHIVNAEFIFDEFCKLVEISEVVKPTKSK